MHLSGPPAQHRRHLRPLALVAGAVAVPVLVVAAVQPATAAGLPGRAAILHAPAWTATATTLGAAPAASAVSFSVAIAPRDAAGAQAFADAVSDPRNASYGKYLTPRQYTARFGASAAAVASVVSWLRAAGLHTGAVPPSNSYVPVTGSISSVNKAFGTTINSYRRDDRQVIAPASALTVPAALAGTVSDVLGLDTSQVYSSGAKAPATPTAASPGNTACSTYWGENTNTSYATAPAPLSGNLPNRACYTPSRLDAARGVPATGKTGAGATVGIVLWCDSHTIGTDVNTWAAQVGWPALTTGQYTAQDPSSFNSYCTQANTDNAMVEVALDAESIHGAAPDAKIIYSAAAGPYNSYLLTATQNLVNANQVQVISNSWGGGESTAFLHSVYVQAASQGISVLASSGDAGDNTYSNGSSSKGTPSADYPASDSELTSIGGTSLGITSSNSVLFEQAWYDVISRRSGSSWLAKKFYGAGGGGKSAITAQPSYQVGIVPASFAGSPAKRAYPDIANIADSQTGYVVGVSQSGVYTTFTVGGTSLASPYTAGEVALAVQTKGAGLGFLNPKLYLNRATAVTDLSDQTVNRGTEGKWTNPSTGAVTEPTTYFLNAETLLVSSQKSVAGWDNLTGLGAVSNAANFISAIQ
ncbi:MAG: S53 family peptidase [Jatrophihabitans sp.]